MKWIIPTIIGVGFALSFWWLAPLVVSAFIAGMYFMWANRRIIDVLTEEEG